MNHYGRMAMDHSRLNRPLAFSSIIDPIRHYTELGEQVQAAITAAREEILGQRRESETIGGFRARSQQALRTAKETVLAELVWLPPEPMSEKPELDEALSDHRRRLEEIAEATNQDW